MRLAFDTASELCTVIQRTKEDPKFKALWSKPITRMAINMVEKEDEELASDIVFLRRAFLIMAVDSLVDAAYKVRSHDDLHAMAILSTKYIESGETFATYFQRAIAETAENVNTVLEARKLVKLASSKRLQEHHQSTTLTPT